MGKTKTAFIGTVEEDKKSSKQKYEEKMAKRKAQEEAQKSTEGEQKVDEETEKKSVKSEPNKKQSKGKKYLDAKGKIDNKNYSLSDAIKKIKEIKYSNFDETLELHLIVKKYPTNVNVTLPHSFGKEKKVVFANQTVISDLEKGKINFDVLLASPEVMPKLVKFARILGPKGLMPNPKNGTLVKSEKDVEKFGTNSKNIKTEKEAPLIHTSFGKISMEDKKLEENANAIFKALGGNKQIVKAYLKSTMSPSIKISL